MSKKTQARIAAVPRHTFAPASAARLPGLRPARELKQKIITSCNGGRITWGLSNISASWIKIAPS